LAFLHQLIRAYRRHSTPASDISLCTALALLVAGGIAIAIDTFVTPWADGPGMLWIGGFYLAIAVHGVLRKRAELASDLTAVQAQGRVLWHVGKTASTGFRNRAARETP